MNQLYQVRDKVGQVVIVPIIICKHKAQAIRIFGDAIRGDHTELSKHPGDYELIHLGEQDDETGAITPLPKGPEVLIQGTALQQQDAEPNARSREALRQAFDTTGAR